MKQYIVRKFVMANNVMEAIKKSARIPIEEAYVNPEWKEPDKPIEGFKDKKVGKTNKPITKNK
jgi:hypothetical protein